jgi:hypothetical protein
MNSIVHVDIRLVEELVYDISIRTRLNNNTSTNAAVFMTLIGQENDSRKCLLQYAVNNIFTLQTNRIDRFFFIDRNIGMVSCT